MAVARPGVLTRLRTGGPPRAPVRRVSASFGAYALVIWAFTQAPIALVTALRETSIVFALLIGVFFLKEKLDLAKLVVGRGHHGRRDHPALLALNPPFKPQGLTRRGTSYSPHNGVGAACIGNGE